MRSLIIFIVSLATIYYGYVLTKLIYPELIEEKRIVKNKETLDYKYVTATIYHAVEEQTNSNPNITASGFRINLNPNVKLIAVSRDLLKEFPYGSIVEIEHVEINNKFGRYFVVLDTMNKRFSNMIDILITPDKKGNKWEKVKIRKM